MPSKSIFAPGVQGSVTVLAPSWDPEVPPSGTLASRSGRPLPRNRPPKESEKLARTLHYTVRVGGMLMRCAHPRRGQTTTEMMLLISVIVIAIVAAAYILIPTFQKGVQDLADDVSYILSSGDLLGAQAGSGS